MASTGAVEQVSGPYTWEDFLDLDDDDRRELIDGEYVATDGEFEEIDVARGLHEYVATKLIMFLGVWATERKAGMVLSSLYRIRINERHGVMPDLQYYSKDNPFLPIPDEGLSEGHPDLVVEVHSPSSRNYDRTTKRADYASIGTPEYWMVDPKEHTLEQLVLKDGVFFLVSSLTDNAIFRPETFPGLEIRLGDVWAPPDAEEFFKRLEWRG